MGLKNKSLIVGWLIMAAKTFRRQNLLCPFEDWLYENWGIKRQTTYNYRNLHKLMSIAPKLMYFVFVKAVNHLFTKVCSVGIFVKTHKHRHEP